MLAKLRAGTPVELARWSQQICSRILASEWFNSARAVMIYIATPEEPDLSQIAKACFSSGKHLIAARPAWDSCLLAPASITNLESDLVAGRHGLREPAPHCPPVNPDQIDLILVPGVAFDSRGVRLGRGGGFYDRFLCRQELRARRVGVAFDLQIVDRIPAEPHDAALEAVITPSRIISPAASD